MDWVAPPASVSWTLPKPLAFNGMTYPTITLRAPSAGDVLMATTIQGASGMQVSLQLISTLSAEGVPYEALAQRGSDGLPAYLVEQMASYLDMFGGAPLPLALAEWHASRIAAIKAESTPTA